MQFDLVSPERALASMEAAAIQIPGTDGDMTVMADHAPTITTTGQRISESLPHTLRPVWLYIRASNHGAHLSSTLPPPPPPPRPAAGASA